MEKPESKESVIQKERKLRSWAVNYYAGELSRVKRIGKPERLAVYLQEFDEGLFEKYPHLVNFILGEVNFLFGEREMTAEHLREADVTFYDPPVYQEELEEVRRLGGDLAANRIRLVHEKTKIILEILGGSDPADSLYHAQDSIFTMLSHELGVNLSFFINQEYPGIGETVVWDIDLEKLRERAQEPRGGESDNGSTEVDAPDDTYNQSLTLDERELLKKELAELIKEFQNGEDFLRKLFGLTQNGKVPVEIIGYSK